ncbi:MAG: right-handed parallel beta-helix repeat-containing protein, partial [Acidimicrobiia bacterium]
PTQSAPTGCTGVAVRPGDDIQAKLNGKPDGTVFCLAAGTYRMTTTLVPKTSQQLVGDASGPAILSGAKPVSAVKEGSYWVITGQTTLGTSQFSGATTQCRPVNRVDPKGMCVYKDQVFLDDVSLWQVGSLAELSSGEFFWDYGANKIYLINDPTGRKLERSVFGGQAIRASYPGVTVRNLVIEKFGNGVQSGSLSAGTNWNVIGNDVRLNHGGGIHQGPGTLLASNHIHHNGQLGIHGGQATCAAAKGLVAENNEIAFNNIAGYNWAWEGGATKWTHTDGLIARGNYVHDNYGVGLWTDADNINVLYENNLVEDNHAEGINHELSQRAIIRYNTVRRNGFHHPTQGKAFGSGIFIDQSRDVEVYGNIVELNNGGIAAVQEPAGTSCYGQERETINLFVHDNTVRQQTGWAGGLQLLNEPDTGYYSRNNRWENNTYYLGNLSSGLHFRWSSGDTTAATWRSFGHDDTGRFNSL